MTGTDPSADTDAASPVRELLGDDDFRNFWIAQVLYAGVNGTLRFTFIWLVVTLTDWPSAEGLVAIALGIPAMLLSMPAGAWSDRVDRKQLYTTWVLATTVALGAFTVAIAGGWVTPIWTGVAALVIGTTITINLPNIQAMVPLLVHRDRLMNAVALQNGGAQAAAFIGLALGGVSIQVFGDAGGFGLLTVVSAGALVFMARVQLPPDPGSGPAPEPIRRAVATGARFALRADPLRTLLVLSLILGGSFSVMQVSMPRVVEETFGQGSTTAGIVLGSFGIGMLSSSAAVARLGGMRHGLNVARYIGIGLGMGQFLLSFAPNEWVAIVIMLAWGLNAGVALASHRTLLQKNTPSEMMGRVMGLMMFGFMGGLPIGALTSSVLAPHLGPVVTMRTVGLATMAITIPLTFRRAILDLR